MVSYLFVLCALIKAVVFADKSLKSVDSDLAWYAQKLSSNETGIFDSSKVHVLSLEKICLIVYGGTHVSQRLKLLRLCLWLDH